VGEAMQDWDKINAVDRMQKYIVSHIEEEITMQDLSRAAGYSLWHALRIFKELTQKTPFEYIRALRLTKAAKEIRDSDSKIIDVALNSGFDSHDVFTRAFARQFAITPQKYRNEKPFISYFIYRPVSEYYLYIKNNKRNGDEMKDLISRTVTVQAIERPARRLILQRSKNATDYWSYCEEKGCEWEGLNDIPEKFDTAAILELPRNLMKDGTSSVAAGIEVSADYTKSLPDGYEMIELPACTMLYFRGMPFENEEDFEKAIDIVFEAIANYTPEFYGYAFADELAPKFNYGASAKTGAKAALPVKIL
jgi:AraC-like DNA-binding protein